MKLVVNTNRIIAALVKDSVSRKILYHGDFDLLGIRFSDTEIAHHKAVILKKARISEQEFENLLAQVTARITFLDDRLVSLRMGEALEIMSDIDPDDAPFIAAALATGADIWSEDKHFTKQDKVNVWKTADLAKILQG